MLLNILVFGPIKEEIWMSVEILLFFVCIYVSKNAYCTIFSKCKCMFPHAFDCVCVCVCVNNTEHLRLLEGIIREIDVNKVSAMCQPVFP